MDHAKSIALAKDLLADGRGDDVVRMIDPLLEPVDAPAADTGQLLLRALRAQVAVVDREAPDEALGHLPARSEVSELCACVRADVALWRGWAHALRNATVGEATQALRLLSTAHDLHDSIHDPAGRCWSLLGSALAHLSLDEYALARSTLEDASSLVEALDDTLAQQWWHRLRIPALRTAGRYDDAWEHIDALRTLASNADHSTLHAIASAHAASLHAAVGNAPSTILETAEHAVTVLSRSATHSAALRAAHRAQIEAHLRRSDWTAAHETGDRAARSLPSGPVDIRPALRAEIALRRGEEVPSTDLTTLLTTPSPLPRGISHAEVMHLHGRLLARQDRTEEARTWLRRAERAAAETGDRKLQECAHQSRIEFEQTHGDGEAAHSLPPSTHSASPQESESVVAESDAMRSVLVDVSRAAASRCPVLLSGERGTGKARLARRLHTESARANGPFERVRLADLQHTPTAERLFGTVDASGLTPGALHLADGGTLLLEDVDALPLPAQATVLEAIDAGTVVPEGGTEAHSIDVRIVATTTTPLDERVREGSFRPDLRDRFSTLSLPVPSLRNRRADIPLLVREFLKTLRPEGAPMSSITQPAMEALLRYDWPGNVRQLRNEIERVLVHVSSEPTPTVDADSLLDTIVEEARHSAPASSANTLDAVLHPNQTLSDVLSQTETAVIERVLETCDGQVTASAEVLGLTRQGLYKKMKRLGIDASEFQPTPEPASTP